MTSSLGTVLAPPPIAAALRSLPFANSGVVTNSTRFMTNYNDVIYLESEVPYRPCWSWADGHITPFSDHRYLFEGDKPGIGYAAPVPPLGMRSAPPLGGLAAGTVELRADGSLRAWTIENASPAGSTKTAWLDDAVYAPSVSIPRPLGYCAMLLPPPPPANPEVDGSRPVS